MSKARGCSDFRKTKRGRLKIVFYQSLIKFFRYRLSTRGWWIQDKVVSSERLTTRQINKVINNNIKQ